MGKGKRAREARAGKREEMQKAAAKLRLRQKITKIVSICVAIVIAVGIIGTVAYSTIASTGLFLRNTVAMSTENFKVDNAMMTYYLKNEYQSFVNTYSDYLSMYGLDTTKSLKSQEYGDGTWFDYFLNEAKTEAQDLLLCAEKAKADGKELTDEDYDSIDESIETLKTYAKENNVSFANFLSQVYAQGINEKDVRRAMELSVLASNYYGEVYESFEYTDEDLQSYFDDNKSEFIKADYLSYSFVSSNSDTEAAKAESKTYSDALSKCKTPDEFKSTLETMLTTHFTETNTTEDAETAKTEIEGNVQTEMDTIEGTNAYPSEAAEDQDELTKWMFADTTAVGDTFVVEPEDDGKSYTVYMMVNPMYFDDYVTANVRHILISADTTDEAAMTEAKAEADSVVEEFNSGEKTEAAFEEIAKEHSDDTNAQTNGGLYEGVVKDTAYYPEAFINWSFDEARKTGDVGIIESESGYHVMYYVGTGEIAWKAQATSSKKDADWTAHLDAVLEEFPVKSNDAKMESIKA